MNGHDASLIPSIDFYIDTAIRGVDKVVRQSVLEFAMSDERASGTDTISLVDALIKNLRAQRARVLDKFDRHLAGLEDIRKNIGDIGGIEAEIPKTTTGKKGFYQCNECTFNFYQTENQKYQHECNVGYNLFEDGQLDDMFGPEGWEIIGYVDPPPKPQPVGNRGSASLSIEPEIAPPVSAQPEQVPVSRSFSPRAHGLRPDSKRHRVYKAIEKLLLKQEWMHVDDILKNIQYLGVFEDVKDQRTNLFNILSQLKSKGLLISDNRGNWALAAQRTQNVC